MTWYELAEDYTSYYRGAERDCRCCWALCFVLNGCFVVQFLLLVLGGLAWVPLSLYLCSAFEDGLLGRGT